MSLAESLAWLGAFFAALVIVALIVVWRGRRRGSRTIALNVTLTASSWLIACALLAIVLGTVTSIASDVISFPTELLSWDAASELPCEPAQADRTTPTLTCVVPESAHVTIDGAPLGLRTLLAIGEALTLVAITAPLAAIAVMASRFKAGTPFAPGVVRALYISAGVILVAGISGELLTGIGRVLAVEASLPAESTLVPHGIQLTVPFLPIGGAILCAALASIIQHGAKLQRDTEGLV
ncbi:hypothetical protein [Microbacterium sp. G2-8]|uniref:hypothetical protein n=1 Tax=Microbacterium sp. G2-8 TaxID=2842454 RepID=UPI001C89CC58|nr:hypothetical protein [Microbacterium sp. G2-8]